MTYPKTLTNIKTLLDIMINMRKSLAHTYYALCYLCLGWYEDEEEEHKRTYTITYNKEDIELIYCIDCHPWLMNNINKVIENTKKVYFSHCVNCFTQRRIINHHPEMLDEIENYKIYQDAIIDNIHDMEVDTKRILFYILCDKCYIVDMYIKNDED